MPSNPYLMSSAITPADPFIVKDNTRMFVTVRSATAVFPDRWVTIPIQTDNANYDNPFEVAAFLNQVSMTETMIFMLVKVLIKVGSFGIKLEYPLRTRICKVKP